MHFSLKSHLKPSISESFPDNSKFGFLMDAKYGAALRNGNIVVERIPDLGKENEIVENRVLSHAERLQVNGISKDSSKRVGLNTSEVRDEHSVIGAGSKSSNALKLGGVKSEREGLNASGVKDKHSVIGTGSKSSNAIKLEALKSETEGLDTSGVKEQHTVIGTGSKSSNALRLEAVKSERDQGLDTPGVKEEHSVIGTGSKSSNALRLEAVKSERDQGLNTSGVKEKHCVIGTGSKSSNALKLEAVKSERDQGLNTSGVKEEHSVISTGSSLNTSGVKEEHSVISSGSKNSNALKLDTVKSERDQGLNTSGVKDKYSVIGTGSKSSNALNQEVVKSEREGLNTSGVKHKHSVIGTGSKSANALKLKAVKSEREGLHTSGVKDKHSVISTRSKSSIALKLEAVKSERGGLNTSGVRVKDKRIVTGTGSKSSNALKLETVRSKSGGLNTYQVKDKHTVIVTGSISSNALKKSGAQRGNHSKKDKIPKDQASQRGLTMTFPSKQNLGLSQSLASPSRGILTSSSLRTSNADKQKKNPHVRDSHMNGNKSMPLVPNGRPISTFQSSNSNKRASAGVGSRGASNGAVSSKQNTLASSKTSVWRSKSVPTNAIVNNAASKAHISTASHGQAQQRGKGSGFPLRSTEPSEKRKPLPKLEEKIHEKEVGITNLQEKSKKSKEAEMKQQKKSLAVKATPTPRAKVELKKLPTAQPKPQMQGQSKSYVAVTDCSHTGGGSSRRSSSNSSLDRSNKTYDHHPQIAGHGDSTSSNKPVRMSISKLPSQKASVVVKLKVADSCSKTLRKCRGGKEQNLMKCVEDSPPRVELELFSILDDDEDDEVIISLPDPP